MKKHRNLFLALGLGAMLGLSGREANAGTLTITIDFAGLTSPITVAVGTPTAQSGSSENLLQAATSVVNGDIAHAGAAFQFSSLGATSNSPGSGDATVTVNGELKNITGTGLSNPGPITITATLSGFSSPTGTGTLTSSSSGTFTSTSTSTTEKNSSSLGSASTSTTYTSMGTNSFSNGLGTSVAVTSPVATGYSISDTSVINLINPGSATAAPFADATFSVTGTFTTVPEPASLVMMLTGMPLPLVIMGILRRRRAAA